MEMKFYKCAHCGKIIAVVKESGVPVMCCGQKMTLLQSNTVEASTEKHLPVVTVEGDKVNVVIGSAAHPMVEEHSIQWVYLLTDKGGHRRKLSAGEAPEAVFALCGEKPIAVYAYCNLHGLWKTDI